MTDDATARLAMPLLQPEQAQKEMFHNEALAVLDLAVQAVVEAVGTNVPPVAETGQCWIVGVDPSGDWTGHAGSLGGRTAGGWRFARAFAGMTVWSREDDCAARFDGVAWRIGEHRGRSILIDGIKVIGAQGPAIVDPAGGAVIDAEARDSLIAIVAILRNHGLIAV